MFAERTRGDQKEKQLFLVASEERAEEEELAGKTGEVRQTG